MLLFTSRLRLLVAIIAVSLSLAACASAPPEAQDTGPVKETQAGGQEKNPVMSVASAEKAYRRNSDDPGAAVRYSRALREAGRLSRASIVIAPFARDERRPSASAKAEFAAVQVALGNNATATDYARKAIAMNGKSWQAHYTLGQALDAQGDHAGAEPSLRKALSLYRGNPVAILNTLGLNLAAQGYLDEAEDILHQARDLAANPEEVERNLRIVNALRESGGRAPSYMIDARNAARKKTEAAAAIAAKKAAENAEKDRARDSQGDDQSNAQDDSPEPHYR